MPDDPDPGFFDSPLAALVMGDFANYAHKIGNVTWAWNALHGELCGLFCAVTGIKNAKVPQAIWHSHKSDRNARAMLLATVIAVRPSHKRKRVLKEIIWLIKQVGTISGFRNETFHIMWKMLEIPDVGWVEEMKERKAELDVERGSPLGRRLVDKDPSKTFHALSNYTYDLVTFASALSCCLKEPTEPSPNRPRKPRLLHSPPQQGRTRKSRSQPHAKRQRPRRSSPA